jgi:hypothetical protein
MEEGVDLTDNERPRHTPIDRWSSSKYLSSRRRGLGGMMKMS